MLSLLLLILGLNRPKKALLLTAKVHLSIVYTYKEKGPNHLLFFMAELQLYTNRVFALIRCLNEPDT